MDGSFSEVCGGEELEEPWQIGETSPSFDGFLIEKLYIFSANRIKWFVLGSMDLEWFRG